MAVRKLTKTPIKKKIGKGIVSKKISVSLPTIKSTPSNNLEDYTWMIHGEKKIGKTSLVSHFDNLLFLMFEPGGKSLEIFQTPTITDWAEAKAYVKELESSEHDFKNVCIDPGNQAYERCLEYVCKQNGIIHPGGQNDYGQSWKKVSSEFQSLHIDIAHSGMGFIVIAHSKEVDKETRTGETFSKVVPVLSGSTEEFYAGIVDIIAYYHYVGGKRFLQIRGDDYVQAGARCENNFLTPSGEQVFRIPMGDSSKEGYKNLVKAFNNQQEETYANVKAVQGEITGKRTPKKKPLKKINRRKKVSR